METKFKSVIVSMMLIGIVDIICIMIICLFCSNNTTWNEEVAHAQVEKVNDSSENDVYIEDEIENFADIDIQKMMLKGIYYSDGKVYCFMDNNRYSGYFDDKHVDVSDYKYDLVVVDNVLNLIITDQEEKMRITYYVYFKNNGSIELQYGDSKIRFDLEK